MGAGVGTIALGVAVSCKQNPFIIDVAAATLLSTELHPEALIATEEAAETAAGNWLHAHVQSVQPTSQGIQGPLHPKKQFWKVSCTQVGKSDNPGHWEGSSIVAPTSTNKHRKRAAVG